MSRLHELAQQIQEAADSPERVRELADELRNIADNIIADFFKLATHMSEIQATSRTIAELIANKSKGQPGRKVDIERDAIIVKMIFDGKNNVEIGEDLKRQEKIDSDLLQNSVDKACREALRRFMKIAREIIEPEKFEKLQTFIALSPRGKRTAALKK